MKGCQGFMEQGGQGCWNLYFRPRCTLLSSGEEDEDQDDPKKKKSSPESEIKEQNVPLGEIGTGLGLLGEGALLFEKKYTNNLFNQGFRRGINGNYQLTGRNLSLFGDLTMTSGTRPFTGWSIIGKSGGMALRAGGSVVSLAAISNDGYNLYNNNLSFSRFGYRFTGYVASVGVGFAFGGPYGAAVGTGFVAGEIVYDTGTQVKKEVGIQFNRFYRTLINGWLNSRR